LANHAPSEVVGDMPTIDLTPTLLSLAGVQNDAPFLGEDLLTTGDRPGRAFLNHNHNRNRNIGMLTGDALVVLGLQKTAQYVDPAAAATPSSRLRPMTSCARSNAARPRCSRPPTSSTSIGVIPWSPRRHPRWCAQ